jgi:hypothetical protein
MGLKLRSVDFDSSRLCPVNSEKPMVGHHGQI